MNAKENESFCPLCGQKLKDSVECFGHGDYGKALNCSCGFNYAPYIGGNFEQFKNRTLVTMDKLNTLPSAVNEAANEWFHLGAVESIGEYITKKIKKHFTSEEK